MRTFIRKASFRIWFDKIMNKYASFLKKFVNENLSNQTFGRRRYFLDIKLKKNFLHVIFKHKISNWNLKLSAKTMEIENMFFSELCFAFTNLLKMWQKWWDGHMMRWGLKRGVFKLFLLVTPIFDLSNLATLLVSVFQPFLIRGTPQVF